MSNSSTKATPGGGGSKQHDYFGSIAGIVCAGRLDFIWGLLLDGKLVWPTTTIVDASKPWDATPTWLAGNVIAYNGLVWEAVSDTSAAPPDSSWKRFRRNRVDVAANPYKFTVPNWGDAYLYWGTDDQALDTVNEKFLNTNGHPAYRHRAVLALKNFLFGTERQSAPNAVLLGGRAPMQTLITCDAAALDDDWQANPWCVLAELLTHSVIGLGLPDSALDATSWQAQADACLANHTQTYISPIYDRQQQVRSLAADLLQYMDGFLYWTTARTIAAGDWPHGEEPPVFTDANTIDVHDLVEPVQWRADSWRDTTNATVVNYCDINYAFNSVPAKASNLYNRAITRRVQSRTLDRPFIVRAPQATALATEDAKLNGEPKFGGDLLVRAEKVSGVGVGDIFLLTDDTQQLSRACRCTGKTLTAPPVGTAKLAFETERGLSELPYRATPVNPTPDAPPQPALVTYSQIVQIPPQLSLIDSDHQLACLAARNNGLTTSLGVWWKNVDTDAFERLTRQTSFAVFGEITTGVNTQTVTNESVTASSVQGDSYDLAHQDIWNLTLEYSATGSAPWTSATNGTDFTYDGEMGEVTILTGGAITDGDHVRASYAKSMSVELAVETPVQDIERISSTLTADEIANNTLLLFVFKDNDPKTFEILSVKSVTAAGSGVYTLAVRRALYGSRPGGDGSYVFTTADRAYIIYRSGLTLFTHEEFADISAASGTATFRLTPATAWYEAGVENVYDAGTNPSGLTTETTYDFGDPYPPLVAWTGLFALVSGTWTAITDFTTVYAPGTRFRLIADLSDANADLTAFSVSYYKGGNTAVPIANE